MEVKVRLYDELDKYSESNQKINTVNLPEGASIKDMLNHFGIPEEEAKIIVVNGLIKEQEDELDEGDEIRIFHSLVGG